MSIIQASRNLGARENTALLVEKISEERAERFPRKRLNEIRG